jgi:hypothetical protein
MPISESVHRQNDQARHAYAILCVQSVHLKHAAGHGCQRLGAITRIDSGPLPKNIERRQFERFDEQKAARA